MRKTIIACTMAVCGILAPTQAYPQDSERKKEIIEADRRTNDYFMSKYNDPTLDTYVKKRRTSNLWTRA
ncbi:MAG: glycoside hydrolase family 88 protein, partial [Bacteroidales bacterium]|nr:glycoside hydrolase family 88 protein [Bacteroidales bacterium]